MKKFIFAVVVFVASVGQAAPGQVDRFFEHLRGTVGDYHQATVALLTSPEAEPKDMEMHELENTLNSRRLSNDKYLFQTLSKDEKENTAASIVFERKNGEVHVTHHDLNEASNSYQAKANVSGDDSYELSFYRSDVTFLDVSDSAKAKRKAALQKRQLGLAGLVLVLTLAGERVPAEVIENEDWMEVFIVNRNVQNPIALSNILLDPKGKSERHPKGEKSLTILQLFHKGH